MNGTRSAALAAVAVVLMLPAGSRAHAIGAEVKLKDGRVHVEGYFDDDTAAAGAKVRIEDAAKVQVAQGVMDDKGRWSCPAPAPGSYRVIVDAGGGHRASVGFAVPPSGQPAKSEEPVPISDGPPREEFTRFPWLKLGLGLAVIACLGLVAWLALRARRSASPPPAGAGA